MDKSPLVFVSHSSKDENAVKRIISFLRSFDIRYWVSFENLGEESQFPKISEQIGECDVFLFVWSANSLNSHQVDAEVYKAHGINKPFAIYQLDAARPPLGLDMLVGYKQFRVLPAGTDQDRLGKLAKIIFLASGMSEEKTDLAISERQQQQKLEERRKIDKWVDRFWAYKYDANRRRVRELSRYDESRLAQLAKQLGIAKEVQAEYKSHYKRDMRSFSGIVRSAFRASSKITESDIYMLDEKRKLCCIPAAEAKEIVLKYRKQPILPGSKSEFRKAYAWIFDDSSMEALDSQMSAVKGLSTSLKKDAQALRMAQEQQQESSNPDLVGTILGGIAILIFFGVAKIFADLIWFVLKMGAGIR
jgi:hypothetical protein